MGLWSPGNKQKQTYQDNFKGAGQHTWGPRTIAIASGKGGVGKTSLAVNLALCLAQMGYRTTLFDADLGMSNVEVMLGLVIPCSLYDVLYRDKTLEEIAVRGPFGVNIVSSGSGFLEMANLDQNRRRRLISMLNQYSNQDDFVLIDTGAGINKNVLGFVAAADEVIIVVTPEPTSLTDAYAIIKVLATFKVHSGVHIVVNRSANKREARRVLDRLQVTAARFLDIRINNLGWLQEDGLVVQAIKKQEPFLISHPNSAASRSVTEIAEQLTYTANPGRKDGFWHKLMSIFARGG
ncbi:MAG: MinD/ParA family protein [Peptococcaceae bacterium]|nr:MinD/ParA family protein [Peptococcaceae bacterium]